MPAAGIIILNMLDVAEAVTGGARSNGKTDMIFNLKRRKQRARNLKC
jgi:hypothetical protein